MTSPIIPHEAGTGLDMPQTPYSQQSPYKAITYPQPFNYQCSLDGFIYAGPHAGTQLDAYVPEYRGVATSGGYCPRHAQLEMQLLHARVDFRQHGILPSADVQRYFYLQQDVRRRNGEPIEAPFWHTDLRIPA